VLLLFVRFTKVFHSLEALTVISLYFYHWLWFILNFCTLNISFISFILSDRVISERNFLHATAGGDISPSNPSRPAVIGPHRCRLLGNLYAGNQVISPSPKSGERYTYDVINDRVTIALLVDHLKSVPRGQNMDIDLNEMFAVSHGLEDVYIFK